MRQARGLQKKWHFLALTLDSLFPKDCKIIYLEMVALQVVKQDTRLIGKKCRVLSKPERRVRISSRAPGSTVLYGGAFHNVATLVRMQYFTVNWLTDNLIKF